MTINKNRSVIFVLLACLLLTCAFCFLQTANVFAEEVDTPVITQYTVTFYSLIDNELKKEKDVLVNDNEKIVCPDFSSDFTNIKFYEITDFENKTFSEAEFDFETSVTKDIDILLNGDLKSYSLTCYSYENNEIVLKDTINYSRFIAFDKKPNFNKYLYIAETQTIGESVDYECEYREDLVIIEIPEFTCTFKYSVDGEETLQEEVKKFDYKNTLDLTYMGSQKSYNKFLGWTTNINDYSSVVESVDPVADIVLYEYVERLFKVTIKKESSSGEELDLSLTEEQKNGITTTELLKIIKENENVGHYYDLYYANNNNENYIIKDQQFKKKIEELNLDFVEEIMSVELISEDKYISYLITYKDLYNATLESKVYSYIIDSSAVIKAPERTGYIFDGWIINGNVYQTYTIPNGSTGDIVAQATWTAKQYTVSINNNGTSYSKTVSYDEKLAFLSEYNTTEKKGYSFDKWKTKKGESIGVDTFYTWDNNIEIEAVYKPNKYNIHYDLANGEEVVSTEAIFDSEITLVNNPKKIGYTFDNWYYNDQIFTAKTYIYDQDINLTAKWIPNTYSLTIQYIEKEQKIEAVYDSSLRIEIPNDVDSKAIVGFIYNKGEEINSLADREGYISVWNIAENITVVPYYICADSYIGKYDINVETLHKLNKDYKLFIDDEETTLNYISDEIGYHSIRVLDKNNEVIKFQYVVEPEWKISATTYKTPLTLNRINAKVTVDGKEIDTKKDYRIDKNGTHVVVVTGANGYTQEYTIVYSNPNINYFWYVLAAAIVIAIPVIVLLIMGRRRMIIYGMDRE